MGPSSPGAGADSLAGSTAAGPTHNAQLAHLAELLGVPGQADLGFAVAAGVPLIDRHIPEKPCKGRSLRLV
jgi:hypothetical protein